MFSRGFQKYVWIHARSRLIFIQSLRTSEWASECIRLKRLSRSVFGWCSERSFRLRIVHIAFGWRSFPSDGVRIMFGYLRSDFEPNFENSPIHSYSIGDLRIKFVSLSDRSYWNRFVFGWSSFHHPLPPSPQIRAKIRMQSEQNRKKGKNPNSDTVAATVVSVWQPHKELNQNVNN